MTNPDVKISTRGLPQKPLSHAIEIAIRVSLSAPIGPAETAAVVGHLPVEVDIQVGKPDVMWLNHPDQLTAFGREFRRVLGRLREAVPNCTRLHLFFAGPMGCAVIAGQAINPRMNPPVQLYDYDRRQTPRYQPVLLLA